VSTLTHWAPQSPFTMAPFSKAHLVVLVAHRQLGMPLSLFLILTKGCGCMPGGTTSLVQSRPRVSQLPAGRAPLWSLALLGDCCGRRRREKNHNVEQHCFYCENKLLLSFLLSFSNCFARIKNSKDNITDSILLLELFPLHPLSLNLDVA